MDLEQLLSELSAETQSIAKATAAGSTAPLAPHAPIASPPPTGEAGAEIVLSDDDRSIAAQLANSEPGSKELANTPGQTSAAGVDAPVLGPGTQPGQAGLVKGNDPYQSFTNATHRMGPIFGGGVSDANDGFHLAKCGIDSSAWVQGPDAHVVYETSLDSHLAKSIMSGVSPELPPLRSSMMAEVHHCGACDANFSKALTVCPDCGVDMFGGYGNQVHDIAVEAGIRKSIEPTRTREITLAPDYVR